MKTIVVHNLNTGYDQRTQAHTDLAPPAPFPCRGRRTGLSGSAVTASDVDTDPWMASWTANVQSQLHKRWCPWNELMEIKWGSNRTNNIDGAEAVQVAHNAILVFRMHLVTIALLCKQTTDNFRTRHPPEPRWRHLSGNRILFVSHYSFPKIVHYSLFCHPHFFPKTLIKQCFTFEFTLFYQQLSLSANIFTSPKGDE